MTENLNQFSVYWWDREGNQHSEMRWVNVKQAVDAANRLANGPGNVIGIVERVIITNGGDDICFEWRLGEGVVFA